MHCAEGYKYFLRFWNYRRSNFSCVSCFALESKITLFRPTQPPSLLFITNDQKTPLTLRHAWHRSHPPPLLCYLFLFFEVEKKQTNKQKKQRYGPTHYTSTNVYKQLNQIIRFKWKIIKLELESLFSMNCHIRK